MRRDLVQTKRPRLADQNSEDSAPTREVADQITRLRVDAEGEEAVEAVVGLVEDPERGVFRPGHLAGALDDT